MIIKIIIQAMFTRRFGLGAYWKKTRLHNA